MATQKNTFFADLVAARSDINNAERNSENPHFRSKYADLGNVIAACVPGFAAHNITYWQGIRHKEIGPVLVTMLIHVSGETLEDDGMPLLNKKGDMQGLGSALTYARRYGLLAAAGIAPVDDDGNAAVQGNATPQRQPISEQQFITICDLAGEVNADVPMFCKYLGVDSLKEIDARQYDTAIRALEKKRIKPEAA